jgi:hypothetical protein
MKLFEIITTSTGESFVRSYAWCESVDAAKALFVHLGSKYEIADVAELLDFRDAPRISDPSDCGFGAWMTGDGHDNRAVFQWAKHAGDWMVSMRDKYGLFLPGYEQAFDDSDIEEFGPKLPSRSAQ